MKSTRHLMASILTASLALLGAHTASAHVTYSGRDFGTFVGDGTDAPATITIGNLSSKFGWADATDADFGDSHRTRAFRFKLTHPAVVTLHVQGTVVGVSAALPNPAFSIFSGLAHVAPDLADHDATAITVAYLNTLGGVQPKEGALIALGNWKIGNDPVYNIPGDPMSGEAVPASLSSFTYAGHAADGTAANYGSAPGIHGDGVADGSVAGTFALPAGDYSIFIGGADYAASIGAVAPYPNFGVSATLSVAQAPEVIVKGGACSAFGSAIYGTLYNPATNGAGTLALRAQVKIHGATFTIIARRTVGVTALARNGDHAPDTLGNWKTLGDPVINENGEVAFTGALLIGPGGVTAADDAGVWTDLGGALHLALREGDPAPGAAVGQLFTKPAWFSLADDALFISAATSDGTVKGSGVWKWDHNGLAKVVVPGDSLTLLDGTSHVVKTVSKPTSTGTGNASSRLVGSDGTLALLVVFTDGRIEVVTFH